MLDFLQNFCNVNYDNDRSKDFVLSFISERLLSKFPDDLESKLRNLHKCQSLGNQIFTQKFKIIITFPSPKVIFTGPGEKSR